MIRIETKTYSWGRLVTVSEGHDFSIVLHPEHMDTIRDGGKFTSEDGTRWTVTPMDDSWGADFIGGRHFESTSGRVLKLTKLDTRWVLGDFGD